MAGVAGELDEGADIHGGPALVLLVRHGATGQAGVFSAALLPRAEGGGVGITRVGLLTDL